MMSNQYRATFPAPTVDSKPFWDGCDRGELLLQHCMDCAKYFYYARRLCPHCGSQRLNWRQSSGRGKIFSFSEVCVSFFGPDWNDQLPYTVALIDLQEGPRILSRLIMHPREVPHVGAQAHVVFTEVEARKLPFFSL